MFTYPELQSVENLESQHDEYGTLLDVWQQIDDLVIGGWQLEQRKERYIVGRPGEDELLYSLRLAKFAYTPILGSALKDYSTRITNAPFHVAGCNGDRWDRFRGKTDGKRRDERSLLNKIFRTQLCYGRAWAFVDRPTLPTMPVNRLQEELMGDMPYVVLYEPLSVINWGIGGRDEVLFVKLRQIISESSPFGGAKLRAVWTIVDDASIVKYEAYVKLDESGKIVEAVPIVQRDRATANDFENPRIPISDGYPIAHGRGRCPVVYLPIEPELWSCNIAYLKAKQHLQIENAWTDTATIAGYVQRVFTPRDPVPDSDPNVSFSDVDSDLKEVRSSNAHILIGKDFKFSEANGTSLQVISEFVLDKIENQIKAIVNLGNVSAAKGALEQSGVSKALDYNQLNETMKMYGKILCEGYEEILKQVAIAFGMRDEAALEAIKVAGLDSFDVDNLGSLIEQSLGIKQLSSRLAPMTQKLWWIKLAEAMITSADAETKEVALAEYDAIDYAAIAEAELQSPTGKTPAKPGSESKSQRSDRQPL